MQNYRGPKYNTGENLEELVFGDYFLMQLQCTSNKREKWYTDLIKNKHFCSVKDTIKSMRQQATDWEKICPKGVSYKGLLPKIHNSSNSTIRPKKKKKPE